MQFGNVVDGSTDSIQRVFYFWGLQMVRILHCACAPAVPCLPSTGAKHLACCNLCPQEKQGVVTAEGQVLPPRWVIKDMVWQSMKALV